MICAPRESQRRHVTGNGFGSFGKIEPRTKRAILKPNTPKMAPFAPDAPSKTPSPPTLYSFKDSDELSKNLAAFVIKVSAMAKWMASSGVRLQNVLS